MDRINQRQERRRLSFQKIRLGYKTSAALSEALGEGFSPSYVSQLLSGHRGIGDEVADKIEDCLHLSPGWLDQDHAQETELPSQDRQFLDAIQSGVTEHDIPDHIRQTILTLIASSPEKK